MRENAIPTRRNRHVEHIQYQVQAKPEKQQKTGPGWDPLPQNTLQIRGTVGEQVALKLQSSKFARSGKHCPFPRFRVSKAQRVRVQQAPVRESERVLGAVEVVAQDWMTYCIHMKSLPRRTKRRRSENGTPVIFLVGRHWMC